MGSPAGSPPLALGFLTTVNNPLHGLFGGYLILDTAGRPIEFHCTAPIKPTRAQEILFGPTLEPYLVGEQIGKTLLAKAERMPSVVCTDQPAALAVRPYARTPVALVLSDDADTDFARGDGPAFRIDRPQAGPRLASFRLGSRRLAISTSHAADQSLIGEALADLADELDLLEPFGRIREAIEEAQRGGR